MWPRGEEKLRFDSKAWNELHRKKWLASIQKMHRDRYLKSKRRG